MAQTDAEWPVPWDRPPSPWLRRYGGNLDPMLRLEGRSGLAPMFPSMEPSGVDEVVYCMDRDRYADPPVLQRPSGADLDILLWTEATQRHENQGWKSWQVGAFAEVPSEEYIDLIEVNETKWHPLFRRERWYDLQVPLVPGEPKKGTLSVDNPRVWKDLSVVIELANRLFIMLVDHGFFDVILSGTPFDAVQCTTKSKAYNQESVDWWDSIPVCAKRANIEEPLREVRQRVRERLVHMAPLLVTTWFQDKSPQGYKLPQFPMVPEHAKMPPQAQTMAAFGENNEQRVLIRLAASLFRPMVQCDETTRSGRTEKRLLMLFFARLMVHEMAHAVYMMHVMLANQSLDYREPAIEDDFVAELGYAAEQAVFGGAMRFLPWSCHTFTDCMHSLSSTYLLDISQFPGHPSFSFQKSHWDAELHWPLDRIDVCHAMPASHAAHLLSETYWRTRCQGQFGMAALRPLQVFPSAEETGKSILFDTYKSNVWDQTGRSMYARQRDAAMFPGIRTDDDREGCYQHVYERLLARQALWNQMRPWYRVEMERWSRTPYGHYQLRFALRCFSHAVRTENEEVAFQFMNVAKCLLEHDQPDRVHDDVLGYYRIVFLMMTAAAPWRPDLELVEVKPEPKSWMVKNLWQPSSAARKFQTRPDVRPFVFKWESECVNTAKRYQRGGLIFDTLRNSEPRRGRIAILTRALYYLDQLYKAGGLQTSVYQHTYNQLVHLDDEARQWREPFYTGFLSSFVLELPTYDLHETWPNDQPDPAFLQLDPATVYYFPFDPATFRQARPTQPQPRVVAAQFAGPVRGVSQVGGPRAFMVRVVEQDEGHVTIKYWSAGEVGDHNGEHDTERWVLVDNEDEGGYDVFDVSTLDVRGAGALQVDFKYGVRVTDHGLAAQIRALDGRFRGRLLLPRSKEEIAENDGLQGRCKWVRVAGPYIYDITHFPAQDDDEHELLWSAPHGNVLHAILTLESRDMADLQRRLYPFRCATLLRPQPTSVDCTSWRPYTMREVNLHVFPDIRALTCVDGWVYDITEFADTSPLGRQKLLSLAGREVGESLSPPDWAERFLRDVEPHKVGFVVPERRADHARLARHEIQLINCVYTFEVLLENNKTKEDADLGRALSSLGLGGMDATEHLAKHRELMQLTKRPDLVVAKLYSEPAVQVNQEDLEAHGSVAPGHVRVFSAQVTGEEFDQEGQESDEDHDDASVWARIGDVVYDVSNLVNYGDSTTHDRALAFAGGAITDASLMHDIQQCGMCPTVGKFVGKPTERAGQGQQETPRVKRKRSKRWSGFFGFDVPPPSMEDLAKMGFGGADQCGCLENVLGEKDREGFFIHEEELPAVDPEDLAAFGSYVGVHGKRLRLV